MSPRGRWPPRWRFCALCKRPFWSEKPGEKYCHSQACDERLEEQRSKANVRHQQQWNERRLSYKENKELWELNEKARTLSPTQSEFVRAIRLVQESNHKRSAYIHLAALALAAARRSGSR